MSAQELVRLFVGRVHLTGRAFATRHGQTVQGTTEIVALGAANLAAGVLRGFR